jgi:hypothetical protein
MRAALINNVTENANCYVLNLLHYQDVHRNFSNIVNRIMVIYIYIYICSTTRLLVFLALQPVVVVLSTAPVAGFSLLVFRGFLITYNDAPQSVVLLWTSDQSVAETST